MFCQFCKEILEEDNSVCINKACVFLNKKIKDYGVIQFYLMVYGVFERYDQLLSDMKGGGR